MYLTSFNRRSRSDLFSDLRVRSFDLVVIGGGITGASIFRDAALRGMKTLLLEAGDFACGTSSRSSKLIHGGLRYLKTLGFRLAMESCGERNLHIRLNKRLVSPIPFLMPLYRGRGEAKWRMRMGMLLYEVLSGLRNYEFHRFLSREETLLMAPALLDQGLIGGCLYYDAIVSDNRWTLETVKAGVREGGIAFNYTPVTGFLREGGHLARVVFRDRIQDREYEVRGRCVVNATGVFADRIRILADPEARPLLRLSKGTHLVFAEEDVPLSVTTVFPSPLDGRPLFLAKREGCFLYGTTDDWEDTDPGLPIPGGKDVDYLLDSLRLFLPDSGLNASRVQFVYSGFRPLLGKKDAPEDPSDASREDAIEVAPHGLITVAGGKMTTARLMACRVLQKVFRLIGENPEWLPCKTDKVSLGGPNEAVAEGLARWVKRCPPLTEYFRILFRRYGPDAEDICERAIFIYQGKHPDPKAEPIRAEVQYVCRNEMVCTLEDLLDRRAGFLYWNAEKRLERLRHGKHLIREELGFSDEEFEWELVRYQKHLERFHSLPLHEGK